MGKVRAIGRDIWEYDVDLRLAAGLRMPSRSTIVRLASGALVVHAPLAFDEEAAREIETLGEPRFVIAPACTHWMFVRAFQDRWPSAKVLVAPGLEKKLTGEHAVAFEALPSSGRIDAIGDELRVQRIEGAPSMNEHVFLHRASGSLIVTDLLFNIQSCSSFLMRLTLRLTRAWRRPAQSRAWRFFVKDRALAAQSAAAVLGWDFDRVVVAHGEVMDRDARAQMTRALAWMVDGTPPLLGAGGAAA